MIRFTVLGGLLFAAGLSAAPQMPVAPPQTTVRQAGALELHHPVERDLGANQADRFTVDAMAGQFLRVVAEQKGVRVMVRILDPEGKMLVTADRGNGTSGTEAASAIAPRSGAMRIQVESSPAAASGRYVIELTDLRDPTDRDRRRIEAEGKLFQGTLEQRAGDLTGRQKAIEHLSEAAALWADLGDGLEQGLCLGALGVLWRASGDRQKALHYFQQALDLQRRVSEEAGEATTLLNMATLWEELGDRQKQLESLQQSLALRRTIGDRVGEAGVLRALARLYVAAGDRQKAIDTYEELLQLGRSVGGLAGSAVATLALAALPMLSRLPHNGPAPSGEAAGGPPPETLPVHLMMQSGHSSSISGMAVSADGRFIVTTDGQSVILWSAADGKAIRVLDGHTDQVNCVAFLPGGGLATGSRDKTVRIWNIQTGRELRRINDSITVSAIAISPAGDLLATASDGITPLAISAGPAKEVHLWDLKTGSQVRAFVGHSRGVRAVAFSPDGKSLASGGADHTARLWDVATGKELRRFNGHATIVNAVAFSPDGSVLATASGLMTAFDVVSGATARKPSVSASDAREAAVNEDHTIRMWRLSSGEEIRRIAAPAAVAALAFSRDGSYLASGGGIGRSISGSSRIGCEARVWNAVSGEPVGRALESGPDASHDCVVLAVAFSPDAKLLVRSVSAEVILTDALSGKEVLRLRGHASPILSAVASSRGRFTFLRGSSLPAQLWNHDTGHPMPIPAAEAQTAAFSPDDSALATAIRQTEAHASQISFWDTRSLTELRRVSRAGNVTSMRFSSDGKLLLVQSEDQSPCILEAGTGAKVRCFQDVPSTVGTFLSPHGDALIAITKTRGFSSATVLVLDAKTGSKLRSFSVVGTFPTGAAAISPAGDLIAVRGMSTVLYNWRTGELVQELYTGQGLPVSFSPDGQYLAVAEPGFGIIWNISTGKIRSEFTYPGNVTDARFTSDGRSLLLTGSAGFTTVWDFASGKQLCSFVTFNDGSWAVTDPDGRYDASNPDEAIGLHWVAGTEVIELGQLKQRFYTPNLFARILKGEPLPEVASIQTIKLFPSVDVAPPAAGSTRLNVKLTNRGGGIGRVAVRVNGKEISQDIRGPGTDPAAASAALSVDLAGAVRTVDGQNSIEVVAYDALNLLSSRGVKLVWTTPAAPPARRERLFAVIAGVSEYDNPALNLRYPAKDAQDMYQALKLAGEGLFEKGQVSLHLLATGGAPGRVPPTKEQFRRAFSEIASQAEPQDVLVIFLAGHGVSRHDIADRYYFLTGSARSAEVAPNDLIMLDRSTISSEELRNWCLNIKALKQVIILDTCAAGAAIGELNKLAERREISPDQARAMELLKDSTGSHILAGSATNTASYEASRYGQGLLTYALLQGMKGEALEEGQRVDVLKLFQFASTRVVQLASDVGGIQQPQISSPGGRSFPIGLLSDEDKRAIRLANLMPQLLRVQCFDEQDGDSLGLAQRLRVRLKEATQPVTRGAGAPEPSVVYVDEVLDIPSAMTPVVRYQIQSGKVVARVTLRRDSKPVSNTTVTASADPAAAAHQIADAIVQAATKVGGR
jgi:WD40 repeat protein